MSTFNTHDELEAMRAYQRKRKTERRNRLTLLLKEAREDARLIVERIREEYRPLRIYQWGSLLDGRHFSERSDIDIAIEGIVDPERFFAILGTAESMTSFPVDIVQIETMHPVFAEIIRMKGRLVYER